MEHAIGETVIYGRALLRVTEDTEQSCAECYFSQTGRCDTFSKRMAERMGVCDAAERSDGKNIVYRRL